MEFKKAIKRIVALGTGASMVGATIFGAMAADLAQYPNQFIKDGKFSGVLVVGDKAAAEDVIGVSDIAVSLQFAATKPASVTGTTTETAEGDAWKVGTSTKILEMSENLGSGSNTETIRNITTFIDDSELDALASGTSSNGKGDAPYNQYLYLLGSGASINTGYVIYTENDQDTTADFLYFKSGHEIGRYLLEFTTSLESDIDDSAGSATSTGTYLTDFEDTEIKLFGKDYTIVQARRVTSTGDDIKLILMGGAQKDTLLEGATKTYTIGDTPYEVTLNFVDADEAQFVINAETTRKLKDGDTDKLSDGTTIGVSEILYQDYAGGVHSATFFLGAQKMELKDNDINDVVSDNSLKIDDNTIDDAYVVIEASDDNSSFKLSRIHINMTADDNFFVPAGGKLSENPDLTEPQVLFTNNWDIEYRGLTEQETETIELKTSGNKKYQLKFKDGDGNEVELPLMEATAASTYEFGEKDKSLINQENRSIAKDDYIILTDTSSGSDRGERKTYVLQYKGADKVTADNPVLKFKNLGSGETIEQTYSAASSLDSGTGDVGGKLATLKSLGGADYAVYNASSIQSNDFSIFIDQDADGSIENNMTNFQTNPINITTYYGCEIGLWNNSNGNGVMVLFKTPDNGRDGSNTIDNVESLQASDYAVNATADSNTKVAISVMTTQLPVYLTEKTPDGETDVQYSYTSYGTFITRESPSSEPGTLKLEYPKKQREAQVYITAKGATFTEAAAASETGAVTVQRIDVGAIRLASEVLSTIKTMNSILVGGPCANEAARIVMGSPADCLTAIDVAPGEGVIKLYDVDGNVAMLVAGYLAADTRDATTVVGNYKDYTLKGSEMRVSKVNNVLTVAEPTEEVAEETPAAE